MVLLFVIVIRLGLPVKAAFVTAQPLDGGQFTERANVFEAGRLDVNVTLPGAPDTETFKVSPRPEYVCIGVV